MAQVRTQGVPAVWDSLARALRKAWSEQLPQLLRKKIAAGDLAGADRLARVLRPADGDDDNPAARLRQEEARRYWTWLGDRYRNRARALARFPAGREFYQEAARDYLEAAP